MVRPFEFAILAMESREGSVEVLVIRVGDFLADDAFGCVRAIAVGALTNHGLFTPNVWVNYYHHIFVRCIVFPYQQATERAVRYQPEKTLLPLAPRFFSHHLL